MLTPPVEATSMPANRSLVLSAKMFPCRPSAPPTSTKPPPVVSAMTAESPVPVMVAVEFSDRTLTLPEVAVAMTPLSPLTKSDRSTVEPPAWDSAMTPVAVNATIEPVAVVVTFTAPLPTVSAKIPAPSTSTDPSLVMVMLLVLEAEIMLPTMPLPVRVAPPPMAPLESIRMAPPLPASWAKMPVVVTAPPEVLLSIVPVEAVSMVIPPAPLVTASMPPFIAPCRPVPSLPILIEPSTEVTLIASLTAVIELAAPALVMVTPPVPLVLALTPLAPALIEAPIVMVVRPDSVPSVIEVSMPSTDGAVVEPIAPFWTTVRAPAPGLLIWAMIP